MAGPRAGRERCYGQAAWATLVAMSLWLKTGNRLIDADRAYDIEYAGADSGEGGSSLAIRFLGGAPSEITLHGPLADAAWKAIRAVHENQGTTTDLDARMIH